MGGRKRPGSTGGPAAGNTTSEGADATDKFQARRARAQAGNDSSVGTSVHTAAHEGRDTLARVAAGAAQATGTCRVAPSKRQDALAWVRAVSQQVRETRHGPPGTGRAARRPRDGVSGPESAELCRLTAQLQEQDHPRERHRRVQRHRHCPNSAKWSCPCSEVGSVSTTVCRHRTFSDCDSTKVCYRSTAHYCIDTRFSSGSSAGRGAIDATHLNTPRRSHGGPARGRAGRMDALIASASSVSTRAGGDMTLGLASPRGPARGGTPRGDRAASAASGASEDPGNPRAPPGNGVVPAQDGDGGSHWGRRTETMLVAVRALPMKGNSMSRLCLTSRAVLDQMELLLEEYSREKTKQWINTRRMSRHIDLASKIDENKTTLGIVVTDDTVQTVLPGGPAFHAGLRKGDRIQKVSTRPRAAHSSSTVAV